MISHDLIKELARATPTKIVMLVIDGLGGLPDPKTGRTELEAARLPHLDALAAEGIGGLADPVAPGITPGSGPGHLALFGYDPVAFNVGRGVLEAVGIDIEMADGDVAARGNFASMDAKGIITDRRAGRIPTEKCVALCKLLDGLTINGVPVEVYPVREHRFVVVFRGEGLEPDITDADPGRAGQPKRRATARSRRAERMAAVANDFIAQAEKILVEHHPANMILLRGFSRKPKLPTLPEIYRLKPLAIAIYPMYRGLAQLLGMTVAPAGKTLEDEIDTLKENFAAYDFFFLHVKGADSAGEDSAFTRKVKVIERVDAAIPTITALKPDVLVVTGDHATPAVFGGHSWHPVPVLICARYAGRDAVKTFSETALIAGGLGRLASQQIMTLAMANALKLAKYDA